MIEEFTIRRKRGGSYDWLARRAVARWQCVVPARLRTLCSGATAPKAFGAGGAEGVRTPDLLNAIQALYQLSYDPIRKGRNLKSQPRLSNFLPPGDTDYD